MCREARSLKGNYRSCKHTYTEEHVTTQRCYQSNPVFYAESPWDSPRSTQEAGWLRCGGLFSTTVILLHHKNVTVFYSQRKDTHNVAHTFSVSYTDTVVLITSICLKLCESAASCWFHRHVKTPLFFPLPSFSSHPRTLPLFLYSHLFPSLPAPSSILFSKLFYSFLFSPLVKQAVHTSRPAAAIIEKDCFVVELKHLRCKNQSGQVKLMLHRWGKSNIQVHVIQNSNKSFI